LSAVHVPALPNRMRDAVIDSGFAAALVSPDLRLSYAANIRPSDTMLP
jgi:hypothetical protein